MEVSGLGVSDCPCGKADSFTGSGKQCMRVHFLEPVHGGGVGAGYQISLAAFVFTPTVENQKQDALDFFAEENR